MSSLASLIGAQDPDQKSVTLVKKITEKTKTGRIAWKKSSTGFIASIRGGLELGIVSSSNLMGALGPAGWGIFTVRDEQGNEIVKVENPQSGNFSIKALLHSEMLLAAVNELYQAVSGSASTEIEKAIGVVDRI